MKIRRNLIATVFLCIILLNVLDALFTPVDNVAQETLERYPDVEDCFDGTVENYLWIQYHHAPQLIAYGCP